MVKQVFGYHFPRISIWWKAFHGFELDPTTGGCGSEDFRRRVACRNLSVPTPWSLMIVESRGSGNFRRHCAVPRRTFERKNEGKTAVRRRGTTLKILARVVVSRTRAGKRSLSGSAFRVYRRFVHFAFGPAADERIFSRAPAAPGTILPSCFARV